MTEALFIAQAVAWPACVAWVAWLAYRGVQSYARIVAHETNDDAVTRAVLLSEQAMKEQREATAVWESATATTTEDLSAIKSALISRGMT